MFSFYKFYFGLYASIDLNIYNSTKRLRIHYDLLLQQHIYWHPLLFFVFTTIIYQKRIHLWFQSKKLFNIITTCFISHFTNHLFILIVILSWLIWMITKSKHFLIVIISRLSWMITKIKNFFNLTKTSMNIFGFNFIGQTINI